MPYVRAQRVMANFSAGGPSNGGFGTRLGVNVPFDDPGRTWQETPDLASTRRAAGVGEPPVPPGEAASEGRTDVQQVTPAVGTQGEQPPSPTGLAQTRPIFRYPTHQQGVGQLGVNRRKLSTARNSYG